MIDERRTGAGTGAVAPWGGALISMRRLRRLRGFSECLCVCFGTERDRGVCVICSVIEVKMREILFALHESKE